MDAATPQPPGDWETRAILQMRRVVLGENQWRSEIPTDCSREDVWRMLAAVDIRAALNMRPGASCPISVIMPQRVLEASRRLHRGVAHFTRLLILFAPNTNHTTEHALDLVTEFSHSWEITQVREDYIRLAKSIRDHGDRPHDVDLLEASDAVRTDVRTGRDLIVPRFQRCAFHDTVTEIYEKLVELFEEVHLILSTPPPWAVPLASSSPPLVNVANLRIRRDAYKEATRSTRQDLIASVPEEMSDLRREYEERSRSGRLLSEHWTEAAYHARAAHGARLATSSRYLRLRTSLDETIEGRRAVGAYYAALGQDDDGHRKFDETLMQVKNILRGVQPIPRNISRALELITSPTRDQ